MGGNVIDWILGTALLKLKVASLQPSTHRGESSVRQGNHEQGFVRCGNGYRGPALLLSPRCLADVQAQ